MSDDPVRAFYARVNARAEADMLAGGPVTGAHHRALEAEIAAYREPTPREDDPVHDKLNEIHRLADTASEWPRLTTHLRGKLRTLARDALAAYAYQRGRHDGTFLLDRTRLALTLGAIAHALGHPDGEAPPDTIIGDVQRVIAERDAAKATAEALRADVIAAETAHGHTAAALHACRLDLSHALTTRLPPQP